MAATSDRNKDSWASKKYREFMEKYNTEKEEHNQTKKDLKEAQDVIAVLTQENLELGKINQDLVNRFVKGGIVYTINDGFVTSAVRIPEYSEWTFAQEIPSEIGTRAYQLNPFYVIEQGQLRKDEKAYKTYLGGIL